MADDDTENGELLDAEEKDKPSKDDILRGKFFERNFEKIIKILREPRKTSPREYIIIGLQVIIILLLLIRPGGKNAAFMENQQDANKKLDVLTRKVDHLEKQLLAIAGIDDQYKVIKEEPMESIAAKASPTPEKTTASPAPRESPKKPTPASSPAVTPAPTKTTHPAAGPLGVKSYKVKDGDTLWVICDKHYHSKHPACIRALGKYNSLKGPNYDLFPGDTIKIPPKNVLFPKKP